MRPSETRKLEVAELMAWLRLIRSENVGPINFRRLLELYGAAEPALEALPELARRAGRLRPIRIGSQEEAARELAAIEQLGGRAVALCEPDYPVPLAAIDDAPPVLFTLGDIGLLNRSCVAIVGARNASASGRRLARDLAADLGARGLVVASGLARGIDAAAHGGALGGGTIATLAGGLDVVYPPENEALYRKIAEQGLIITEVPPGTVPTARHFPRRNRLISGVSLGVLVVEAALRSGSLITARCALEQGREVFAVPGSPLDPRARGCNHLLRQGAVLVESAEDVVQSLAGMATPKQVRQDPGAEPAPPVPSDGEVASVRRRIESLLGVAPVTVDEMIRQSHLSPAAVNIALMELELAGRAERQPGNRYALGTGKGGESP